MYRPIPAYMGKSETRYFQHWRNATLLFPIKNENAAPPNCRFTVSQVLRVGHKVIPWMNNASNKQTLKSSPMKNLDCSTVMGFFIFLSTGLDFYKFGLKAS